MSELRGDAMAWPVLPQHGTPLQEISALQLSIRLAKTFQELHHCLKLFPLYLPSSALLSHASGLHDGLTAFPAHTIEV